MKKSLFPLAVILVSGCATAPVIPEVSLYPAALTVRTGKSDPPPNAKDLGPISATDGSGCGGEGYTGQYERAIVVLKNAAYSRGANYVQVMSIVTPHSEAFCYDNIYRISGTAYNIRKTQTP